jgi:hypothetical protein
LGDRVEAAKYAGPFGAATTVLRLVGAGTNVYSGVAKSQQASSKTTEAEKIKAQAQAQSEFEEAAARVVEAIIEYAASGAALALTFVSLPMRMLNNQIDPRPEPEVY